MHIGMEYNQNDFDEMFFANDIQQLTLTLREPEIGLESVFVYSIDQFLTQEEFQSELETNGLKDMKHLKSLAKMILEDRIQPIWSPDEEY